MPDILAQSVKTLEDLIARPQVGIWQRKKFFFPTKMETLLYFTFWAWATIYKDWKGVPFQALKEYNQQKPKWYLNTH